MACWGDVYLDESAHTAMCLQNDASADVLGEFSISETGGIDGDPGDQTGWESIVHGYYEAWDGILHYPGGADGGEAVSPAPSGGSSGDLPMSRYRAAVMRDGKKVWLDWCEGLYCTDGCGDTYAGIEGVGIVDFEVEPGSLGSGGWYEKNMRNGALIGLTVYYDTPAPGSTGHLCRLLPRALDGRRFRLGKWEHDDDDDGAGNDCDQIDMVELTIAKI